MNIPKAFISYSHDTQEHKKWVLELATRLLNNGIDAIIDQYELQAGDDVPHFMETHLASANKIIMVCTERYVEKANKGEGGVGYEKMIITSNLMKRIDENKIIPIIRQVGTTDVPTFLRSKLYINFSKTDDYEYSYDDLVRAIHKAPLFKKPSVGNNPFQPIEKEKLSADIGLINDVLRFFALGSEDMYSIDEISSMSKMSRFLVDIAFIKLFNLGFLKWSSTSEKYARLTEKGKLYAYENKLFV